MQMSLEAITMLMRFHHRSCCSGIRGIFHPYLENNCMFKIRDTLPSWVSFYFSRVSNKLESGQRRIGGSITYFYSAAIETADYSCLFAVLPSCCAVKFCSISSTFFPSSSLVNHRQNPFVNITIKLLLQASKYHKQSACWCMYCSGGGEKKGKWVWLFTPAAATLNTATTLDFHALLWNRIRCVPGFSKQEQHWCVQVQNL